MKRLQVIEQTRVMTANSVWVVEDTRYMRTPRTQRPARTPLSIDNALDRGEWHDHEGAWVDDNRLRILPAGRHEGAQGIISSDIENIVYR